MTKREPTDVGASVRARLLNLSRQEGEDPQRMLTRYANERLLYRLASSTHAEHFVLKGASLFTLWNGKPHRATRDLDLLGLGTMSEARLREVFTDVLEVDAGDDGVRFDIGTLTVSSIREEQEYGGLRVELTAQITTAKLRLQVDVGFGDAVTPEASVAAFPVLLDFPEPKLRVYPRETVVAEKLEAMVQLGVANSRMKDFYDVAVLARDFDFNGPLLTRAIRATFDRRKTRLPTQTPVALTDAFAQDAAKQTQWAGFVRKAGVEDASDLQQTVAAVRAFLGGPMLAAATGTNGPEHWRAGGPWGPPLTPHQRLPQSTATDPLGHEPQRRRPPRR